MAEDNGAFYLIHYACHYLWNEKLNEHETKLNVDENGRWKA